MRAPLHLVDTAGNDIRASIRVAVEDAYRWTVRKYPLVDSALIANWAENLACSMEALGDDFINPQRYAVVALKGRVRDWLKTGAAARLEPIGIGRDLERFGGSDTDAQAVLEQNRLLEQVTSPLNERDRIILTLLLGGFDDAEIASALHVSASAGRKAIQRMRERISPTLNDSRRKRHPGHELPTLCETKG